MCLTSAKSLNREVTHPVPTTVILTLTGLPSPDQREVVLGANRLFCLVLFVEDTAKSLSLSSVFPFFPLQNDLSRRCGVFLLFWGFLCLSVVFFSFLISFSQILNI